MGEIIISGTVEDIIYQNTENGYCVFSMEYNQEELVCVGTLLPLVRQGESLKMTGSYVVHPIYGRQFSISYYEKKQPSTAEGMEKYLASGIIKGIGARMAKKITDKFGAKTFDIIEQKPERLAEIKGITNKKADEIHNMFIEQQSMRNAMMFMQGLGISPAYAMKIYKKYKDKTFDIIKTNPYRLADDIFGIGFKVADRIAASNGMPENSAFRIKSGIKFVLNQAASNGHIFLTKFELINQTSQLLNIDIELVDPAIVEMQLEREIWQENINGIQAVYLNMYYYAEIAVAKKLLEIASDYEPMNYVNLDAQIESIEKKTGVQLAGEQKRAVKESMQNGLLIITGGPGTGKTTTINTIIKMLKDEELEVLLAAPTGRAAKRMTEATGIDAQTIHRLLGINFVSEESTRQVFDRDENNPIDADVIIVDEVSMVDIVLMHNLLKAIAIGTRLILVGDVDQLPSVGPGNVLKDIIKSGRLNVVRLNEIFRQAKKSAIVMNAHRINMGERPVLNGKESDFFFLSRNTAENVVNTITELITKRLPSFTGCNPLTEMQVLTPMRKGPVGVYNLNSVLQEVLNPSSFGKNEKQFRNNVFREGDKVMQIKNNYNISWRILSKKGKVVGDGTGVFNGDEGIIKSIDDVKEVITVVFDENKYVDYDYTQLDELEVAYAITIHKSQGSEYPVIIIPIFNGPPMLMSRNLLYTAVTRAKKLVVLVGIKEVMNTMIENNREINRYSTLDFRICSLYDFMNENSY